MSASSASVRVTIHEVSRARVSPRRGWGVVVGGMQALLRGPPPGMGCGRAIASTPSTASRRGSGSDLHEGLLQGLRESDSEEAASCMFIVLTTLIDDAEIAV